MSLTILCTHCHEPAVRNAVDTESATFCSEACRAADASRAPRASTEVRVLVAFVHNMPVVPLEATKSVQALGWGNRIPRAKDEHGIAAIDCAWYGGSPRVDDLRNRALLDAQRDGFTHVLFLDTDMVHPDDLLHQILRHVRRPAVVSGFYTQRKYPFAPIALRDGQRHESGRYWTYRHDDDYADVDADGLRDEDVVGMGCTLIPLALLDTIGPRPWFEYRTDADGWALISEDVPFCEKVRAAGGRVCLDPAIQCGHLYVDVAVEAHWQRARAVQAHTREQLQAQMAVSVARPEGEEAPA
jgi:hypothetical protein